MRVKLNKIIKIMKENGVLNGSLILTKLVKNKLIGNNKSITTSAFGKIDVLGFYDFIRFPKNREKYSSVLNRSNIKVLWFIPDFGIGSGGHLNIFRMISNLESLGIESDIVICGNSQWGDSKTAQDVINKYFFNIQANIYILSTIEDIEKLGRYDVAMATSWQTAYYVNTFSECYKKSYFVQDFEPYFSALGSVYSFSENTYKMGFYGITAGSWLSKKLYKEYGMNCNCFSFSYDRDLYHKHKKNQQARKHIFFYARPPTERRAFELGLLVLDKLTQLRSDVSVIFAGWDISNYKIPFNHLNAGTVKIEELSHLYAQCDVALVLSLTNLSLLPLEIIASGCPVVINDGENNDWIDPERKLFHYTEANIDCLVSTIIDVLDSNKKLDEDYISNFLNNTSWLNEAKKVKNILLNEVLELK